MKKIIGIIVLGLLLNGNAYAKVKSKNITFPGKYYTKEIKSCSDNTNRLEDTITVR